MSNKKYKVRILGAVIETDENGEENVKPTIIEIPVQAASTDEASKVVTAAIRKLVPAPAVPPPNQVQIPLPQIPSTPSRVPSNFPYSPSQPIDPYDPWYSRVKKRNSYYRYHDDTHDDYRIYPNVGRIKKIIKE